MFSGIDKMTERERAHPPSVPTSPTETSPPSLDESAAQACASESSSNAASQAEGLDPEGQEMISHPSTLNEGKESINNVGKVSCYVFCKFL